MIRRIIPYLLIGLIAPALFWAGWAVRDRAVPDDIWILDESYPRTVFLRESPARFQLSMGDVVEEIGEDTICVSEAHWRRGRFADKPLTVIFRPIVYEYNADGTWSTIQMKMVSDTTRSTGTPINF